MQFDACANENGSTKTNFQFLPCAVSLLFAFDVDCIMHGTSVDSNREQDIDRKEKENAYSIFRITKQVSILIFSSMFVYSS
jgi:hypothetical protein